MPSLELCALVAGWLRGRTDVEITVDMHVVSAKASANECREFGQQLRKQLDSDNRPQGLLIVADGASTLTAKAPGSFDERAAGVQSAIDDALTAGDPEALLALDPQLCRSVGAQGRAAWQVRCLYGLVSVSPSSRDGRLQRCAVRRRLPRRDVAAVNVPEELRPIAVVGPTASGKSDLALALAEEFGGEIINIDAMQLYRGMDIGTAKLTPAERRGIPHHLLDVLDVKETATVARYQSDAIAIAENLIVAGKVPVIVGGSMMYVQSLLDEWSFPATDPEVRAKWEAVLADGGVGAVHTALVAADPVAAASILPTDGRRMVRALEVVELTGLPFAASAPQIGDPRWGTRILGVDRDTEELDARIRLRTELMFSGGLVDEVAVLVEQGLREGVTAPRAIGYAQVLAHFDGEYDLAEALERTFIGTRRYVRRQRSWFRRDARVHWLNGADPELARSAFAALAYRGL